MQWGSCLSPFNKITILHFPPSGLSFLPPSSSKFLGCQCVVLGVGGYHETRAPNSATSPVSNQAAGSSQLAMSTIRLRIPAVKPCNKRESSSTPSRLGLPRGPPSPAQPTLAARPFAADRSARCLPHSCAAAALRACAHQPRAPEPLPRASHLCATHAVLDPHRRFAPCRPRQPAQAYPLRLRLPLHAAPVAVLRHRLPFHDFCSSASSPTTDGMYGS
jgi:hypothetical protein